MHAPRPKHRWKDTLLAFFVLDEMVLVLEKYRWDSGASSTSTEKSDAMHELTFHPQSFLKNQIEQW
ncbi:MAG: hypothetical protein ACKN9S_10190 [Pirellula sp.]